MIFNAVCAQQSDEHVVLSFAASAADVLHFATIDRIGRDAQGELSGFQRPQVAAHIREIRDYLEKPNAVLPNPIVVAFTDRVRVESLDGGLARLHIDMSAGTPGLVVDGQQRLSALAEVDRNFQIFVSALICRDEAELRRQFVLINNTKPLPKSLIYELLPTVDNLPPRLSRRSTAADITARLNFENTSLRGYIKQHTAPEGMSEQLGGRKLLAPALVGKRLVEMAWLEGVRKRAQKNVCSASGRCLLALPEIVEQGRKLARESIAQLRQRAFKAPVRTAKQKLDIGGDWPIDRDPPDEVGFAGSRFALNHAKSMFARWIGQRLEHGMLVLPTELGRVAAGDVEPFDGSVCREEDGVIALQCFGDEDRASIFRSPTGGDRAHAGPPGKRITVVKASIG